MIMLLDSLCGVGMDVGHTSRSVIGLRINPLVGAGSIAALSTATASSKFGVPLHDASRDAILSAYLDNEFLTSVMCHVGSQVCFSVFLNAPSLVLTCSFNRRECPWTHWHRVHALFTSLLTQWTML